MVALVEVLVLVDVVLVLVEDGVDRVGDKDRDLIPVVVRVLVDDPLVLTEGLLYEPLLLS
jgi:hypothetical protein